MLKTNMEFQSTNMSIIKIENINKTYSAVTALKDFSFTSNNGEFIVLVGPSGCGKTTLLKIICGLESPDSGKIYIDDKLINPLDAKDREIAMVFQNYALYEHMTIYQNLAFPLKIKRLKRSEIKEKVFQIAQKLKISELLNRYPSQLSGGQRQRVAIGKALIKDAKVFLFDEPMSSLDAQIKSEMRIELLELHRQLGKTFIYVTHDQIEAMSMADRIIVMNNGEIQQIDQPLKLLDSPENTFVAEFIGMPHTNVLKMNTVVSNSQIKFYLNEQNLFNITKSKVSKTLYDRLQSTNEVFVGIKPEDIQISKAQQPNNININHIDYYNNNQYVGFSIDNTKILLGLYDDRTAISTNDNIDFKINLDNLLFFDTNTNRKI